MTVEQPPKKKRNYVLIGLVAVIGLCVACGIFATLLSRTDMGQAVSTRVAATQAAAENEVDEPTPEEDATVDDEGDEPTAEPQPTDEPEATATSEALPAVGENVAIGEVRWTVVTAEALGNTVSDPDNEFIEPATTAGQFVRVTVEIENQGSEEKSFLSADLMDDRDRTFGSYDEGFMFIPSEELCALATINPGVPVRCTFIYEVPADVTGLKIKVTNLDMFGAEEQFIDLGLD